jgi:hypothetical protein
LEEEREQEKGQEKVRKILLLSPVSLARSIDNDKGHNFRPCSEPQQYLIPNGSLRFWVPKTIVQNYRIGDYKFQVPSRGGWKP